MTDTKKAAQGTTAAARSFEGFTDDERAAMKDHAQELKASARRGRGSRPAAFRPADGRRYAELGTQELGTAPGPL